MPNRSRRRFPTLSLVVGLVLLVASPLGWAWLQYDLYREEEEALAELTREGIDCYSERDVFLAQRPGETSEEMWEIMTEGWRDGIDETFPWLRPLQSVVVLEPVSLELAQRIASLPRIDDVSFYPAPEGVPPGPTVEEAGFDFDKLTTRSLSPTDLDQPIPTGRTVLGADLQKLESRLSEAWAGRGETRISDRFAVSIAAGPGTFVGRTIVDGDRRKFVMRWSDRLNTSIRSDARWRSVTQGSPDRSLGIQELPEGPFWYSDYESYPPYVQPELSGFGTSAASPSALLAAGVEYAEALDSGAYAIRFRPFDTYERTSDGTARLYGEWGESVHVKTMTLVVRPDLEWCVERGDMEYAGSRRIDWMNELERFGNKIVVREQLSRSWDTRNGAPASSSLQANHAVFDWNLNPTFAADEFSLASAGAGPLGPPRAIAWYRRWYFATGALGVLLTMYAALRIVARRLLARRELRAAARGRAEPTPA